MRNRTRALGLGLLLVLASGCTTTSQGEPGPAPTSSSPGTAPESTEPSDELPTDGAPAVPNPLDTRTFQQDPCQMLTSTQSQELNVGTAGKPYDEVLGKGCEWRNEDTRGSATLAFLDKDPRGLSALYRADKEGKWAYFEELPSIEGFPAVIRDIIDRRPDGSCSLVVGVSDEIAFGTVLQLSTANVGKKDPCEVGAQVAGMALQTMQSGG
jgi:hypothetical protein